VPGVVKECVTILPFAVPPSPKSQAKFVIVWLVVDVMMQLPLASAVLGQLLDASNVDGVFKLTGGGEIVNTTVGASPTGMIVPSGTSLRSAVIAVDDNASDPVNDARIETMLTLSRAGGAGGGGAVKMTLPVPFAVVVIVRADKVPNPSLSWPPTSMSRRTVWLSGPLGPFVVTFTTDVEEPSCDNVVGDSVSVTECATVDGPVKGGTSVW
jgi:hypothetical protein